MNFDSFRLEFTRWEALPVIWILCAVFCIGLFAFCLRYSWLRKVSKLPIKNLGAIRLKSHLIVLILNLIVLAGLCLLTMQASLFVNKKIPDYEKKYIYLAFDVSASSLAKDINWRNEKKISRLEYQKKEIVNFVSTLEKEDYVSLDIFAGKTYTRIHPIAIGLLEENLEAFHKDLASIDAEIIQSIPQGTNLASVIYKGALSRRDPDSVDSFGGKLPSRIVIILTDGEQAGDMEVLEKDMDEAVRAAKEVSRNTSFYIVGIGDARKGSVIPAMKSSGMKFLVGEDGKFIRSKPDWYYLETVSQKIGGVFIPTTTGSEGADYTLTDAFEEILAAERHIVGERKVEVREKHFFRIAAVILLIALVAQRYME